MEAQPSRGDRLPSEISIFMNKRLTNCLAVALALGAISAPAQLLAQGAVPLEQRVARLERLMSSSALMELLGGVQSLQAEIRELRGELERQNHNVEQLKQRQRELYVDVDRRLRRVEAVGVAPGAESPEAIMSEPSAPAAAAGAATTVAAAQPGPVEVTPPPVDPAQEQRAYETAFNLLKEGRYEQATQAVQTFLSEFPGGRYADNAQYWLGETYYVTRQFERALGEFDKLVQNYPSSAKVAGAHLKVGYIYDEMGETEKARQALSDLVSNYPTTTAARLAQERLQRIKIEGR